MVEYILPTYYNIEVFILPNLKENIILGLSFLKQNNSILNLNKGTLSLDDNIIDLYKRDIVEKPLAEIIITQNI